MTVPSFGAGAAHWVVDGAVSAGEIVDAHTYGVLSVGANIAVSAAEQAAAAWVALSWLGSSEVSNLLVHGFNALFVINSDWRAVFTEVGVRLNFCLPVEDTGSPCISKVRVASLAREAIRCTSGNCLCKGPGGLAREGF